MAMIKDMAKNTFDISAFGAPYDITKDARGMREMAIDRSRNGNRQRTLVRGATINSERDAYRYASELEQEVRELQYRLSISNRGTASMNTPSLQQLLKQSELVAKCITADKKLLLIL